ncbi:hypothetical protein ACOME3_003524 [Neoechinorhynchus agilis]
MDQRYEHRSYTRPQSRSRAYSPVSASSDEYEARSVSRSSSRARPARDVVRCRTPPPLVKRIVERVPTPEPQIVERVVVRPAPQTIVERVIERPRTPPPRIVHREVTESPQPTIVRTRVVKVDGRGHHYGNHSSSRIYSPSYHGRRDYRRYSSDSDQDGGLNYWDDMRRAMPPRGDLDSEICCRSYSRSHSRMSRSNSFDSVHAAPVQIPAHQVPTYNVHPPAHQFQYQQQLPGSHMTFPAAQMMTNRQMPSQSMMHQMPPQSQYFVGGGQTQSVTQTPCVFQQPQQQYGCGPSGWRQSYPETQRVINLPTVHLQPGQMPFYGFRPMPPSL